MTIQPVYYGGRLAAAATRSRFFLCDDLRHRPAADPERTFVIYMCAYAGDVLNGRLPGPYTDLGARAYGRACLIPGEIAERRELDVSRAALALKVPQIELALARASARHR
jgi:hypothetical protein